MIFGRASPKTRTTTEPASIPPVDDPTAPERSGWRLLPLVFAVPVAAALLVSWGRLASTDAVDLGWAITVFTDAEALYLGEPLYGDPADGYTGQVYTPLFPLLVSLLLRVAFWSGWPVVLTQLGALALVGLVARQAYDRGVSRGIAIAEAVGIGALGWSFVYGIPRNVLFDGRSDHVAWAFALAGLAVTPAALRGSRRAMAAAVLLLTAAFWTKQPAAAAPAAALLWGALAARGGLIEWRRFAVFAGLMAVLNGAALVVLQLTSDGWGFFFEFQLLGNLVARTSVPDAAWELAKTAVLPALTLAVLTAVAVRAAGGRERALERLGPRRDELACVALFVLIAAATAVWFRRAQGTETNHWIGVVWGLAILAAAGYRLARDAPGRLSAAVPAVLAVLFVSTWIPGDGPLALRSGSVIPDSRFFEVPAELRAFARDHRVYNHIFPDLNVRSHKEVYMNYQNLQEIVAGGLHPTWFERRLLARHFDAVYRFDNRLSPFASAYGKEEENYFWKLNRVLELKYSPSLQTPGAPIIVGEPLERAFVPRPGPDPAPWLDRCFAPYEFAGAKWFVHRGGGLWCEEEAGLLRLRESPADVSSVETRDSYESMGGEVAATLPRAGGGWSLSIGGWSLRAAVRSNPVRLELTESEAGRVRARADIPRAALRASGGTVVVRLEAVGSGLQVEQGDVPMVVARPAGSGAVSIEATADSDARLDLSALRLD